MMPKPFKKYYDGKSSHNTFSMPKTKTMTQIRPDDQNKGEEKSSEPKAVILVPAYTYK